MTPQVVLFDLGGVLLPFDRERRVSAIVAATGREPDAVRAFMASDLHRRLDTGEADEIDLAGAVSEFAGRAVAPDEACALITSVFEVPNMELWDLVARLRRGLTVGGFSDNPGFVRSAFPAGATLDPMFFSCELGLQKPAPAAFAAVTARLGVAPGAILFIDDTAANVQAALDMGWDAVRFVSNHQLMGDLAVRGLA